MTKYKIVAYSGAPGGVVAIGITAGIFLRYSSDEQKEL